MPWLWCAAGLLAVGGVTLVAAVSANEPRVPQTPPPSLQEMLEGFDPRFHEQEGAFRVARLFDGRKAVLTLDPGLQAHLESEFRRFAVPFGSVVAIEPASGRLLAYVSYSSANPSGADLARDPTPPTASVFKVVTAAALVDSGVSPSRTVCYGGGMSRVREQDLRDLPSRDRTCATLSEAMGGSINAVFAKLADRHLDRERLSRYASAFGFGRQLPFDVPMLASPGEIPEDRLEFARTAAGFWHMHMSPLHGALLSATIANGGRMPRAAIVDRVVEADASISYRFQPEIVREVISAATAQKTSRMMERTVTHGTARKAFHDRRGRPFLPGVRIAGKTGTLNGEHPYRGYTWWVGFAPAEAPEIAVAALVVNTPRWRIKASYVAREALRHYLIERQRPTDGSIATPPLAQR
ncbi:MAG: penicillin-binding transpeptidase domain-containing protein [Myxococcota bacterium]